MTHRELAQMERNAGFNNFMGLLASTTVYSGNPAMVAEVANQGAKHLITLDKASKTGIDNRGFSQAKLDDKITLSEEVSMLMGFASVKWDTEHLNKPALFVQCRISASDFSACTDSECQARAQAGHDLMAGNIGDLGTFVTALQLTHLQGTIDVFHAAEGSSVSVNAASPADTAAFKTALRNENKAVETVMTMAKFYKISNKTFYDKVMLAGELPPVSVLHTDVVVEVLKKEDNTPITDAHFELSNTKKTDDADIHGFVEIDEVHNGKAIMTITQKDRKPVVQEINIQAKHVNNFVVHLELK